MSKIQTVSVISFLSFSVIVGALVFSRGFLLNRQVIPDKAGPCSGPSTDHTNNNVYHSQRDHQEEPPTKVEAELVANLSGAASWCNRTPVFKRAILLLVDALRYDFVSRMHFLSSRITQMEAADSSTNSTRFSTSSKLEGRGTTTSSSSSSCLFRFVADPPTTTMQRLKALMTGTMPTFIDASANFNSYEVEEDSLIYQLQASGKKLAFLGDDTWLSLFPGDYFKSSLVEAHPSFNAWDLDTVDRAINLTLRTRVFREHEAEWDILITHLLGVDHCGHRYGPNHPEMKRKLREADDIIQFVYNSMSRDTLLVIFGDHGMTHTGDHGGDSKDETDAALILLTKGTRLKQNGLMGGGDIQCSSYSSSISQVDLVPTLATLLGTPIPFSSIGQLVPNFLTRKDLYTDAVAANAAQVERYMRRFGIVGGNRSTAGLELEQDFLRLQDAFHQFQLSRTNQSARAKVNALAHKYLTQVKLIAVSTWTQFNVPMIYAGVVITGLAVISLFLYLESLSSLNSRRRRRNYSVLSWLWPSLPLWSVLWTFVQHSPTPSTRLAAIIVSTLGGLVMFLMSLVVTLIRSSLTREGGEESDRRRRLSLTTTGTGGTSRRKRHSRWSACEVGAVSLYVVTCLAMFSNSFVINEGYMLGSALLFVVFLHVLFSRASSTTTHQQQLLQNSSPNSSQKDFEDSILTGIFLRKSVKCSLACFIMLAILARSCSIFFRCREELTECSEEYLLHKQLSSLPEEWLVHKYVRYSVALLSLAIFVVAFRLWLLYQKCLFLKTPAALIAKFIPSLLVVLLGVFWALQGLPFISTSAAKLRPILNYFPWVFQAVTFLSLVVVWLKPVINRVDYGHTLYQHNIQCSRCSRDALLKKTKPQVQVQDAAARSGGNNNISPWTNKASSQQPQQQLKSNPNVNGFKTINGVSGKYPGLNGTSKARQIPQPPSLAVDVEQQYRFLDETYVSRDYSSCILLFVTLLIMFMTQITSAGITPAVAIVLPYSIICLVGIYSEKEKPSVSSSSSSTSASSHVCQGDSWCAGVAWTLGSQYLFYGTGHQPIFSSIPWDSAFLSTADGSSFTDSAGSWLTWVRPALAIIGNLHVSQIVFAAALPLLAYWSSATSHQFSCHHHCHSQRRQAYVQCGKFLLLHGLKLLACMMCAGWHRRHLMVWKIFAPKFIFEVISFIVTTFTVMFTLVLITRIDFVHHQRNSSRHQQQQTNANN